MSDANTRWKGIVAPFELPSKPQQATAPSEDRSWLPKPSVCASNSVEWHREWRKEWSQATQWCERHDRVFFTKLSALEAALSTVEKTEGAYSPRLKPARDAVARCYAELNQRFDSYTKTLPFTRY